MSELKTTVSVEDKVSSAFKSMETVVNSTMNTFQNFNNVMDVSGTQAELSYKAELAVLREVEQEAQNIIAAQGTQTAQAQDIIESVYEQRKYVQELKNEYENVADNVQENQDEQEEFNRSLREGNNIASGLKDTIGGIVKAYLGIQGARKAFSFLSDSVGLADIQNASETQLKTVLSNVGATENAYDMLYEKAGEVQSRGIYGDEAMLGGAAEIATYISDENAIASMMDTLSNYAVGMSGGGEVDKSAMVDYATQLGKALDGTYDRIN